MKKLLMILTLALALCLVCGAALADEYAGSFTLFEADGVTAIDALGDPLNFTNVDGDPVSLTPYTLTPTLATVKANKAQHAEFQRVAVNGFDTISGEIYPEVYIYVKVNADHNWVNDNADARNKAATCSSKGVQVKKCSVCGITKTVDVPTLAHSYVRTNTSTCLAEGKYVYKCSKCGEDLKADGKIVEEPLDIVYNADDYHKYAMKVVAPSCSTKSTTVADGKAYFQCSVCKKILAGADWTTDHTDAMDAAFAITSAPDADGYQAINVSDYAYFTENWKFDGHDWSDWYDHEDATCYHAEQHKRRCKICGLTYTLPVDDGDPVLTPVWVLDPSVTCKTDVGDAQFICAICGSQSPNHPAIAAANKDDTTYTDRVIFDDGADLMRVIFHKGELQKNVYVSSETDAVSDEKAKISDVPAATRKDGTFCETWLIRAKYKCSVCETLYNVHSEVGHTWADWEKTNDNSPVDKWTRKCTVCNKVETTTVNPGNPPCEKHTWTADEGQTIVCGKNANIKQTCSVCGAKQTAEWVREDSWKIIGTVNPATCTEKGTALAVCIYEGCKNIDYPEIPATGHTPVAVKEVPATCKEAGTKAGFKCSVCGKFLDADKADANIIEALEVIPADESAHDWEEEILKAATCKEAGVALKTCSVCGKVEKVEIEKLAHTWDEGKITKEATKEAKGEKTYTCTACGETKTEEVEYVVTAAPKYSVTGLTYDGQTLKGKLAHDEDTLEAETLNVRVTFFMTGNYYMATIGEVAADGSFSVDGVGPIEYISVVATGSSSVNPDDVVALGSGEITVK